MYCKCIYCTWFIKSKYLVGRMCAIIFSDMLCIAGCLVSNIHLHCEEPHTVLQSYMAKNWNPRLYHQNSLMNGSFMITSYCVTEFYLGLYKLNWLGEKCRHRLGSKIHKPFPHRKLQWGRGLLCKSFCCHIHTLQL